MVDHTEDFHIEEYRALRNEMLQLLKELNDSFRFYLTGISAIIAWLLTSPPPHPQDVWLRIISAWIPLVLVAIMSVSTARTTATVRNLGNYLGRLENRFGEPDFGWQKASERLDFHNKVKFSVFNGYISMGLFVATFAVGISITCQLSGLEISDLIAMIRSYLPQQG